MSHKWIITCEHGGNQIPPVYLPYFKDADAVLQSHRGYDPGAYDLFNILAERLADFAHYSQTSRLLVELNRSLHHKNLFSVFSKTMPKPLKEEILATYYFPYRVLVEQKINEFLQREQQVIHLSIHSFTPVFDGETRKADFGLLYDPARREEKEFCRKWKDQLREKSPQSKIRFNYPYLGKADGFTSYLRRQFPKHYIGIELELNQQHAQNNFLQEAILLSLQNLKETTRPLI